MADADTTGMALIQATAPMVVAAAMAVGGCLASRSPAIPSWRWLWPVALRLCRTGRLRLASDGRRQPHARPAAYRTRHRGRGLDRDGVIGRRGPAGGPHSASSGRLRGPPHPAETGADTGAARAVTGRCWSPSYGSREGGGNGLDAGLPCPAHRRRTGGTPSASSPPSKRGPSPARRPNASTSVTTPRGPGWTTDRPGSHATAAA